MRRFVAVPLLAATTLSGCFSYAPVGPQAPSAAARVRIDLDDPQEVRLGNVTANEVVRVDGEIVRMDESEVVVSALWLHGRNGFETPGEGATVRIPRENVGEMRVRRASLLRSAGIIGAAVLLGGAFAASVAGGGGGEGGGGETPN